MCMHSNVGMSLSPRRHASRKAEHSTFPRDRPWLRRTRPTITIGCIYTFRSKTSIATRLLRESSGRALTNGIRDPYAQTKGNQFTRSPPEGAPSPASGSTVCRTPCF